MTEEEYISSLSDSWNKDILEREINFFKDAKKCLGAKIIGIEIIADEGGTYYPNIILDNGLKIMAYDSEWGCNALNIITK